MTPDAARTSEHDGIVLVKKHDGFGKARAGTEFRAKTYDHFRAFRMLKREHPNENPMAWEVKVDG